MLVTATETFLDGPGKRRGRVCRRADGLWLFVTERLTDETEECLPYWINDHPSSGLHQTRDETVSALRMVLGEMSAIEGSHPVTFDTAIGPYPEPAS